MFKKIWAFAKQEESGAYWTFATSPIQTIGFIVRVKFIDLFA